MLVDSVTIAKTHAEEKVVAAPSFGSRDLSRWNRGRVCRSRNLEGWQMHENPHLRERQTRPLFHR